MIIINNSHYRVDLAWDVDAEGGSNPGGRVVRITKKRTHQDITIPLSVFRKIGTSVQEAFLSQALGHVKPADVRELVKGPVREFRASLSSILRKERMSIKNVVRIDRSPMNARVWCIQLECGHEVWKTANRKPTVKQMRCEKCEKAAGAQ